MLFRASPLSSFRQLRTPHGIINTDAAGRSVHLHAYSYQRKDDAEIKKILNSLGRKKYVKRGRESLELSVLIYDTIVKLVKPMTTIPTAGIAS